MPGMRRFIQSLPHPTDHTEAWAYVNAHLPMYPAEQQVQPYRKPKYPEAARGLLTVQITRFGQLTTSGGGIVLQTCDGPTHQLQLLARGKGGAAELKRLLLTDARRGKLQVFPQGTSAEFRQLLDLYGRQLLALGYVIHVLGSLSRIVALKITKGGRVWWLCDAEQVAGVPYKALNAQIAALGPVASESEPYVQRLHHVLAALQRELVQRFGVALHPTIGQAAAKAASNYIPEGVWLWRPSPTFVAMCRAGGGFRGGYVSAVDYDGPAWKIDVRRQYTAALRSEFPYAVSFGPWSETGQPSNGLFMCTVLGPGRMRVLLNVWDRHAKTFRLQKWNGGSCVTILPTAEITGLAALGYAVLPGYGFVFNRTFTFAPFVQQLQLLTELHGPDSIVGLACKSLGSKVWGKWAQAPQRTEVAYAADRPGADWSPMTRENGDELPNLWTAERTTYNSLQHIELATIVTAVGRAQLYAKAAQLLQQGHRLAELLTDCIIVQGPAPDHPPPEQVPIGSWRYEGWAPTVHTRHTGAHTWADTAHRAGVRDATVADIVAIGHQEAPPEGEAPQSVPRLRFVR